MKISYVAAFAIIRHHQKNNVALAFTSLQSSSSAIIRPSIEIASSALHYSSDSEIDSITSTSTTDATYTDTDINNTDNINSELALLLPGQTLRIRIGDLSASRKAWKKRRRNASPILIPCSILGMNREWMVRWNVMTLLHQIGEEHAASPGGSAVCATVGKLNRAYRQRLNGDLRHHATALGYESVESLLTSLFDERITAEYGISTFIEPTHNNLMLATSLTRRQARSFSSAAGILHFRPEVQSDGLFLEGNEKMIHTGLANVRLSSSIGKMPKFTTEPLGAALRVSPYDEAGQKYKEGDEFNAFVYSYDTQGDNDSPLLVLTADDPRGKGVALGGTGTFGTSTRVFKRNSSSAAHAPTSSGSSGDLIKDSTIEHELTNLKVGNGPFDATVVAISSHSNAAFVDCGVGRKRGKKYGGGTTKVLGMLRFEDIHPDATSEEDLNIKAGENVQVYIKNVSPQSGRFMVTLNADSVKDKKPKDIKLEKQADKRMERLEKQISHEDIEALVGNVYDGVVKAKSKTGNWYYVQPCVNGEDDKCVDDYGDESCIPSLPVGVATFELSKESDGDDDGKGENSNEQHESYTAGDKVRVRLEGIDEKRGQLSLTLMD